MMFSDGIAASVLVNVVLSLFDDSVGQGSQVLQGLHVLKHLQFLVEFVVIKESFQFFQHLPVVSRLALCHKAMKVSEVDSFWIGSVVPEFVVLPFEVQKCQFNDVSLNYNKLLVISNVKFYYFDKSIPLPVPSTESTSRKALTKNSCSILCITADMMNHAIF